MTRWYPLTAAPRYDRPQAGQLVALRHGVWLVERVERAEWDDADRDAWLAAGMPDEGTWPQAPVVLHVRHVGGAKPAVLGDRDTGSITVRAADRAMWNVYPGARWPRCSCCGEPMPCRAEVEEREVAAGLSRVAELEQVLPGCCWSCREPISSRQDSVAYDGANLLLPGREPPVFHTRRRCRPDAEGYERRWLAEDPRRERVLTYPRCGGILVVHADGSSECVAGAKPLGGEAETRPDCRGHLTHDHGAVRACYVGEGYWSPTDTMSGCPRGCSREGHPGTGTSPRPKRRGAPVAAGLIL